MPDPTVEELLDAVMASHMLIMAAIQAALPHLEAARARVCLYGSGPEGPCDCKFRQEGHANSEASGCAELRRLIWIGRGTDL